MFAYILCMRMFLHIFNVCVFCVCVCFCTFVCMWMCVSTCAESVV